MARTQIFISHASADSFLVPLLDKLFEVHGLESWYARSDLRGGDLFPKRIEEQLAKSNVLVVVISKLAMQSMWVTTEIGQFRAHNPHARIIPLVVDDFPREELGRISPYLSGVHAIACAGSVLDGFTQLFSALGHEFLSRKALANRRFVSERRRRGERRTSDVLQRLSVGLIVSYTRHMGHAPVARASLAPGDLGPLWSCVRDELTRYVFTDRQTREKAPTEQVLASAVNHIAGVWSSTGHESASTVLQEIAKFIGDSYDVTMRERRRVKRRGAQGASEP